jgi:hypothetical protein
MLLGTTALLAVIALVSGRRTGRVVPLFVTSIVVGVVTGGVVHFLAQWLSGRG